MGKRGYLILTLFLILIVSIISINLVSSQFGFDDGNLPKVTREPPTAITFDNNTGAVNSSDFWDNLNTINTTQMEDNAGTLNILVSWLESLIEGSFNSTAWQRSGTNVFLANIGDKVGIGTTSPAEKLHIVGDVKIVSDSDVTTVLGSGIIYTQNTMGDIGLHIDVNEIQTVGDNLHLQINSEWDLDIGGGDLFVETTSGNVGIGTGSPSFPLDVNGIGRFIGTLFAPSIRITSVDDFTSTANAGINFGGNSKYINFETDATERMRIISNGNIGIGTIIPEELLNVFGTNISIMVEGDGVTRAGFKIKTNNVLRWDINSPSGQTRLAFLNGTGTEIMTLEQLGSVGIGTNTPDGLLNVFSGSAGIVTARPGGDDLVIEHSASGGMSILTPNSSTSTIIFGSPADPLGADIKWNHDNDVFIIGTRKTDATLRFVSGGGVIALNINKNQNFDFQAGDLTTTGTLTTGTATTGNLFSTTGTFSGIGDNSFVGNVGIGLVSPTSELHIQGTGSPTLHIEDTGTSQGTLILDGNSTSADTDLGTIIGQWDNNVIASINFRTGADFTNKDEGRITFLTAPVGGGIIERMRITELGTVGIGINAPLTLLHVNGTLTIGLTSFPRNITMYSPDGTSWSCGPNNLGVWNCS